MKHCKYEDNEGSPCNRPVKARGLCATHYHHELAGKPLRPIKVQKRYPAPAPGRRICTSCERVKDAEEDFYRRANGGVFAECKVCIRAKEAERKAEYQWLRERYGREVTTNAED